VIGKGKKAWIEIAKDRGIYLNALESRKRRISTE